MTNRTPARDRPGALGRRRGSQYRKPGNAGGGKGPQFKTNATRSEGPGDWVTYQLRRVFRNCRRRCTRKRRQKPATASTLSPGVDGQEFADIEAYGVQRWLG